MFSPESLHVFCYWCDFFLGLFVCPLLQISLILQIDLYESYWHWYILNLPHFSAYVSIGSIYIIQLSTWSKIRAPLEITSFFSWKLNRAIVIMFYLGHYRLQLNIMSAMSKRLLPSKLQIVILSSTQLFLN